MKKRIAIIGWWAAGMMVAATIIEHTENAEIHIFEKNKELWTKVRISWWWRCNVTTWFYKKQDLQKKYTRWRDFIAYSMWQFGPRKMYAWCEEHGVPLKCEDDMRVFPQSNNGNDIVGIFEKILKSWSTHIHFQEGVSSIKRPVSLDINNNISKVDKNLEWSIERPVSEEFIVKTPLQEYTFDIVVITTWWNAYAHTWSSGEWYDFSKVFWHTTTALWPSLNSFLVEEKWIKDCSGVSFSHAMLRPVSLDTNNNISQVDKNKETITERPVSVVWPILLTHFWISWPVTFTYSSHIPYIPISSHETHKVNLVPFADRNEHWWGQRLDEKANIEAKKQLSTVLWYEFTKRWVELFLWEFKIDWTTMISNISRDQRKLIAKLLGNGFPITLIARRPWDEFVTAWWVNTDEVNQETIESKLCSWLFFAWEVLNIDAVTWWFNFQSCWATGRCAGIAVASRVW